MECAVKQLKTTIFNPLNECESNEVNKHKHRLTHLFTEPAPSARMSCILSGCISFHSCKWKTIYKMKKIVAKIYMELMQIRLINYLSLLPERRDRSIDIPEHIFLNHLREKESTEQRSLVTLFYFQHCGKSKRERERE